MSILDYEFMQWAFLVGILLAATVSCIGIVVVLKYLSMMGDTLSHTSLAGAAAGLVLGTSPILDAVAVCIATTLGIEAIHKKVPEHSELSIAIILSAGVGLAGVLSNFVESTTNFNSSLLSSTVAISDFELVLVCCISTAVLVCFLVLYRELFLVTLDERTARLTGVPAKAVNFIFIILTVVTVSVVARTVGALTISSLMVVPVTYAIQVAKSYRQTALWSIVSVLLFAVSGSFLSYYTWPRPSTTIIPIGAVMLVVILLTKSPSGARGLTGAQPHIKRIQ